MEGGSPGGGYKSDSQPAVCLQDLHGIQEEVFLSLPCVLNGGGVASVVNVSLEQEELQQLRKSATTLWSIQKDLKDL